MKPILILSLTLLVVAVSVDGLRIIKPPRACGPVCRNLCPFGRVFDSRGCPTCKCKPRPNTGSCSTLCRSFCLIGRRTSSRCRRCKCPTTICPFRKCRPCKNGYLNDSKGCRTCRCKPNPITLPCPLIKCTPCRYGYKTDSRGCRTCQCKPRNQTTCSRLLCNLCKTPYGKRNRRCRSCKC